MITSDEDQYLRDEWVRGSGNIQGRHQTNQNFQLIMCGVEDHLQDTWELAKEEKNLHTFWKNPNTVNDNYKTQFEEFVIVLESYGVCVTIQPALLSEKMKTMHATDAENPGETENTKTNK